MVTLRRRLHWGEEIEAKVTSLLDELAINYIGMFLANPAMQVLVLPHEKAQLNFFTADSYAKQICAISRKRLWCAYRAYRKRIKTEKHYWDGSFKDGIPNLVLEDKMDWWEGESIEELELQQSQYEEQIESTKEWVDKVEGHKHGR